MDTKEYYDLLLEYEIATEQEINLVVNINGWSNDTLDSIVYARTGYRDFEQYYKCELIYN
tara:strand:+ start:3200 stop:3379 length:180 start_codon:yes stop_codon:yes gene_type:complete